MSTGLLLLIACLVIAIIGGIAYAVIIKVFGIESFSIFRKELYGTRESDDEFYNRFDK